MRIYKILNNNVALIKDKMDKEVIVMGKGIAYKKNIGDFIDEKNVDKVFALSTPDVFNKFQQLLAEIPMEYFDLTDEIVELIKLHLGKRVNESIYLSLSDHIYSSLKRFREGVTIKNVMLWDIKRFYPDEFEIALKALQLIKERFDVNLPEDEAGFIAFHIVNAEDKWDNQEAYKVTKIMQEISNIVRYYFKVEFDEKSVYYYRFITHLKFFVQRFTSGNMYSDDSDNELFETVKNKYKNAYDCVEKISTHIKKNYEYELTNEEKLYLTVHIERIVYKDKR